MSIEHLTSEDEKFWSDNDDILSSADPALLAAVEEDRLFHSQGITKFVHNTIPCMYNIMGYNLICIQTLKMRMSHLSPHLCPH